MNVLIYFLADSRLLKRPIPPEFLEEGMDGIEYVYQNTPDFKWIPERKEQLKLIRDMLPTAHIDPYLFSWPFRRALIESQAKSERWRAIESQPLGKAVKPCPAKQK